MTRFNLIATALLAGLLAGCHKKEVSDHDKMEAANAYSDAQFALSIKDLPRAEAGYLKATQLIPDSADYQLNYGVVEMKLGKKSDAKSAYKEALSLYKAAYKKDPKDLQSAQQAIFVFLILGESSDAKSFLDDLVKDHPENTALAGFRNSGGLDKLAQTPKIKELSP